MDYSSDRRFLLRREAWGYLAQDLRCDRLWALDAEVGRRLNCGDETLPLFSEDPYRHAGSFQLGAHNAQTGLSAPLSISWSLTSRCNSHCRFCCTDSINASTVSTDATAEEICETLDLLLHWKVMRIILGGGEPLVRPDISEILDAFRQRGFRPVLATNGILLEGVLLRHVAEACLNIQISLDTLVPEKYRRLRGTDALGTVLWNLRAAVETGRLVRVVTVLTAENSGELEALGEALAGWGVRQWFIFELLPSGRGSDCYDTLHFRDDAFVAGVIRRLEERHPHFSVWYWGNKAADGCAVYILPDGSLALADYHTNEMRTMTGKQLCIEWLLDAWEQIDADSKRKMLDNFLSENRLRSAL